MPEIRDLLADADCERLRDLYEALDPLVDVRELIADAVVDEPPIEITEGGIIATGYDDALDDLRGTARDGKQWIDDLEERERERTGIDSLKVGHNSVHGYYIEVTNPNLESVPDNYQRRQTLKNSERFVTPKLKDREDEIVGAQQRADEREYELFCEVRREVAAEVERVQRLADAIATLDALVSLATVAAQYDYCRPEMLEHDGRAGPVIDIEGGRHPVVERTQESFVPNDAHLTSDRRLAVITGPNMSGKSTYMRQVAQIVLLAQVGSFVPARAARLTPVERVFTRVGASDDIAGGRSTFMVEMDELATILREADERSLVLLDEVGRGTSTADGMAIAQAITEHLHDEVGATTLFATHHHPLTELAEDLAAAFTLHFEVDQDDGEVVFHHEIAPGAATLLRRRGRDRGRRPRPRRRPVARTGRRRGRGGPRDGRHQRCRLAWRSRVRADGERDGSHDRGRWGRADRRRRRTPGARSRPPHPRRSAHRTRSTEAVARGVTTAYPLSAIDFR